jgi:hypothetical protein
VTDPTPEERALRAYNEWGGQIGTCITTHIATEIRAAEAAMQERCAALVEAEACTDDGRCFHGVCAKARSIAAAIRALEEK